MHKTYAKADPAKPDQTVNGKASATTTDMQTRLLPPKGYKVAGLFTLPAYRAPITQCLMIACVHLLVVGMFNVLAALGGGGQVDPTTSNNANTILYSLFCACCLISGSVCNYLGAKTILTTGGVGYSILAASFWSYNHNKNQAFVYVGGAICGVAASLIWYVSS